MYSNHFQGPRWVKMAIWCSSSLMIFWPTFCWPYQQSKQQQSVRQQLSQLQVGQDIVWQRGSRVMQFLNCRYSFLKALKNTQELRFAAEMKMLTVDTFCCGMGKFAVISIFLSFFSRSQVKNVEKRQVICTFLPLPSSDSITFPLAYQTLLEAMMIPLAPIACAVKALLVHEQYSRLLALMTAYVGFCRCSKVAGFPQKDQSQTTASKLWVLPQGISPKLEQKQSIVLLGNSVTSGVVMTRVASERARQEKSAMILSIGLLIMIDITYHLYRVCIFTISYPYSSTRTIFLSFFLFKSFPHIFLFFICSHPAITS